MADKFSEEYYDTDAAIFALGQAAGKGSAYAVALLTQIAEGEDLAAALAHTSLAAVYAPISEFVASGADPEHGPNRDKWIMHLERAAELGSPPTLNWYGASLLNGGAEFPADPGRGIAMLTQAADLGSSAAAVTLAEAYFDGRYIPQDHALAAHWIDRALDLAPYEYQVERLREMKEQLEN